MKQTTSLIASALLIFLSAASADSSSDITLTATYATPGSSETTYTYPPSDTYTFLTPTRPTTLSTIPTFTSSPSSLSSSSSNSTESSSTFFTTKPPSTTTTKTTTSRCTTPSDSCSCSSGVGGRHCGTYPGLHGSCHTDVLYDCDGKDPDPPKNGGPPKFKKAGRTYCKDALCHGKCAPDPAFLGNDKCYPV